MGGRGGAGRAESGTAGAARRARPWAGAAWFGAARGAAGRAWAGAAEFGTAGGVAGHLPAPALDARRPRPTAVLRSSVMQLSEVFLSLGEETFAQLVREISIGKLKTYQLYESFKTRAHLAKLNTESLRKGVPRFWTRLGAGEEEFARELAQAVLMAHLDMIRAVVDDLGIPNQDGFFDKNIEAAKYLTEGWQQRVYGKFRGTYPEPVLRLYINHLAWELANGEPIFSPAA